MVNLKKTRIQQVLRRHFGPNFVSFRRRNRRRAGNAKEIPRELKMWRWWNPLFCDKWYAFF